MLNIVNYENLSDEVLLRRYKMFTEVTSDPDLHGMSFSGGWTRGTARFWKWVFSLDYTSLYPSAIMWANIGIDTLIEPKDLPQELLDIRAKYFIYYPKNIAPKDFAQFDYGFIEDVLRNPVVIEEIRAVLIKYNVSATPNGMFFRKEKRAIASQVMEDMITQRKVHKKEMKGFYKKIEAIKGKEFYDNKDKELLETYSAMADKENVYQMGVKILINSYYGSLSMKAAVSAGQSEYFSTAITSVGRIANIFIGQEQCMKVSEITGVPLKEIQYGLKTRLDFIAQADTDSVYLSIEEVVKKKFGEDYVELEATPEGKNRLIDFSLNYINKVAMPLCREKLDDVYAYAMNASMPDKLTEDPEVICDCLPGESLISLKDGIKEIDKVNIGDYVLSYNHDKDIQEYNKITNKRKIKTSKKMLTISNSTTTLKCTEDHRIYTKNRGYIEARYIEANDDLLLL